MQEVREQQAVASALLLSARVKCGSICCQCGPTKSPCAVGCVPSHRPGLYLSYARSGGFYALRLGGEMSTPKMKPPSTCLHNILALCQSKRARPPSSSPAHVSPLPALVFRP